MHLQVCHHWRRYLVTSTFVCLLSSCWLNAHTLSFVILNSEVCEICPNDDQDDADPDAAQLFTNLALSCPHMKDGLARSCSGRNKVNDRDAGQDAQQQGSPINMQSHGDEGMAPVVILLIAILVLGLAFVAVCLFWRLCRAGHSSHDMRDMGDGDFTDVYMKSMRYEDNTATGGTVSGRDISTSVSPCPQDGTKVAQVEGEDGDLVDAALT